ncbi:hypothetical protein EVA_06865 [gut metagenome]|uniref:Uncharacterized protein n=1 Tax=gut metagenome TaxID=749906 RepID=J9CXN6_9ZZZZ
MVFSSSPFSFSLANTSPTYWSKRVIMAANWAWVWSDGL